MYEKREMGISRDQLSDDETMTKTFVGNIFRELDGGSKRIKQNVIDKGDQSNQEICCQSLPISLFASRLRSS